MQLQTNNNSQIDSHIKISWQDEYRSALKSQKEIDSFFNLKSDFTLNYKSFIPIKFANKIKAGGPDGILAKQFIPTPRENNSEGLLDPIGDKVQTKSNGIIHRYKSRILFTPTTNCPVICRYCFRKNELSNNDEIYRHKLSSLKDYLKLHPEVNEVILTGGDPLILSDKKLDEIFSLLTEMNIKFLRLHTRTPIIIPARIDDSFIALLKKYETEFTKIIFSLHTNHIDEIDTEVEQALLKLNQVKIDKKTQTVLLKNINDDSKSLTQLFYKLLDLDFTPYYLHHPDKVKGAMHFYLNLEEGRKIYSKLRNDLPGWALPHYVIDNSLGRGKQLAFNPESFNYSGQLLDINGQITDY